MAIVENPTESGLAGATRQTADAKGKIVEHSFWLLKQGYAESTIKGRAKLLRILVKSIDRVWGFVEKCGGWDSRMNLPVNSSCNLTPRS